MSGLPIGDPGVNYLEIPGYPGYAVGDDGTVWSCRVRGNHGARGAWRRNKATRRSTGYLVAGVHDAAGVKKQRKVHVLVLLAFSGPKLPGMETRHLNGNRGDNRLRNLAWGTKQENQADRERHGTMPRGAQNPKAVINEQQARRIKKMLRRGISMFAIRKLIGVSVGVVHGIKHGNTWPHVRI